MRQNTHTTLNLTNKNSCQAERRVHVCLIVSLTLKYPDVNQTHDCWNILYFFTAIK